MISNKMYSITAVCKDDVEQVFMDRKERTKKIKQMIKGLSDDDMKNIASKMADAYCNCCYWDTLYEIIKNKFDEIERGN